MTPIEIKEILDKSGYLFEQKVASVITKLGFHTQTNKAFLDQEEDKSREIDVVAHKSVFELKDFRSTTGICYLNCECKNSTTPYVFITRNKGLLDKHYVPDGIYLVHQEYIKYTDHLTQTSLNAFYLLGLQKFHFATNTNDKAVQMCKIVQNGKKIEAQHTGIIEGFIYPLIKSKEIWVTQTPENNPLKKYCKFFFNIAVVSSRLYTINSEEENSLPVEVGFVPFIREIQTKKIKGTFLITFVNFDYLEEFITNKVELFCQEVHRAYTNNPNLLLDTSLGDLF